MSGAHEETENLSRKLTIGLLLNSGFTAVEFFVGFLSGSLALISDASHNLTDSLSILISLLGSKIGKKDANDDKTYGYGRATILAALINAVILLGLAIYIFFEAYKRFMDPQPVRGGLVVVVALIGIVINASIAFTFFSSRNDLNVRSSFLNMALDTLASVGALLAGLAIFLTGSTFFDPLVSLVIGFLLLYSGQSVIKSAINLLLDGVPEGIDITAIKQAILKTPRVKDMDDLHVWALSTTRAAFSCQIIVNESNLQESISMKEEIKQMLSEKFNIDHATIEIKATTEVPQ